MKHTFSTWLAGILLLGLISSTSFAQLNTKSNDRINITSFEVHAKDNRICFDWATDGRISTNVFEVQQSSDGVSYNTIALVLGPDPKQKGDAYSCSIKPKDKINAQAFYRLKHIDVDGNEQLGDIKHHVELATSGIFSK